MGSVGQYTFGWLPWSGTKTKSAAFVPSNDNTQLGMGYMVNSGTQNDEFTDDFWLDAGTWKYVQVHFQNTNRGIYTIQLDGASQGTIDGYAAAPTSNVYSEITGIVITTPGVKTFKLIMATKNGSSSGYLGVIVSCAWIRTSGTGSVGSGADTPGYTWHYLPWMGHKAFTGTPGRGQSSASLGGGYLQSNGNQNDDVSWDIWLDGGTYKYAQEHWTSTDRGIYSVQLDAVEKGTIDGYAASPVENVYSEVTGITVATAAVKAFKLKMATKNGSSSSYYMVFHSSAWIRTGA